jgi:TPR repeat protein
MIVPTGVTGSSILNISLVGEDGVLLAEANTVLVVMSTPQSAPRGASEQSADLRNQSAPSAPRVPIVSPAEREAGERLIARGEREMEQGGVAVARQFFLRAAQAGLARGALLLAATYDPRELTRSGVQGVQPNIAEARKWYEKARELGAPEAAERLARLGGG